MPERKRVHDSVLPCSPAPMIPPITTKQLSQHGMLQQHREEYVEASSKDSVTDNVPIPLSTLAEAATNTTAGMDLENSSSSTRFLSSVLAKRSWLHKRSSPKRDIIDTDFCGLDDVKNKVAVHVDGEPWRQRAATLTIRRKKDPAVMLHRSVDDWGVEMEMSKLLDWAEERKMIDGQVHSILMKEFSRRIESKTRQRRVRAQDNIMSTLKKAISSGAMAGTSASMNSNIMNNSSSNILWQGGGGDGILF